MTKKINYYLVLLVFMGFYTYFYNYQNPPKQIWDENYHIASAQKYIDHIAFMEPHPPLGKMLIALGEVILHPNKGIDKSNFDRTDYIKNFPKNLSFSGYRFFPTLFAWLNIVLFFFILNELVKSDILAFLGSFLYLFDNAIIVHSRTAMLEPIQLFFIFCSILWFVKKSETKREWEDYLILGIFSGLALMVKANSAILFLLFLIWAFKDLKIIELAKIVTKSIAYAFGVGIIFLGVFYLHFALGKKLPTHKKYAFSKEYISIIKKNGVANPLNFTTMLKDNLKYMKNYEKGVPKLNLCKPGENGSLFIGWPLGIKAINYRWEKHGPLVKYIYLQGNPVTWAIGAMASFLSIVLIVGVIVFNTPIKNTRIFEYILSFTFIYISYMTAVGMIPRVMYLYHYFIPLTISYILAILLLYYLFEEEIKKNDKIVLFSIVLIASAIVFTWWFYSPLSYYKPLTLEEFNQRIWLGYWQLHPIR